MSLHKEYTGTPTSYRNGKALQLRNQEHGEVLCSRDRNYPVIGITPDDLTLPYEPEVDASADGTQEESSPGSVSPPELDEGRLGNTEWCTCEHCSAMATVQECVCCQEMDSLGNKMDHLQCITQNPALRIVILDRDVLRTALVANMDRLRTPLEEPLSNPYVAH